MSANRLRGLLDRTEERLRIVGLMSGTSVDGIDSALVEIARDEGALRWRLLAFECAEWPLDLREAILSACKPEISLPFLLALDSRVGTAFAGAADRLVRNAGFAWSEVDAIASHGQTIWHQPDPIAVGDGWGVGTLQVGDGNVIAAQTGCVVISDFRRADMALDGQGAPLVPFVDYALFAQPTEGRLVLNLGGIANMTWLPAGATPADVRAFDTGPGNMVLDALTRHVTSGQQEYDRDGALAAAGNIDRALLDTLLTHAYFAMPPPKSTGREQFGASYAHALIALPEAQGLRGSDLLATATALTAETVVRAYDAWIRPIEPVGTVVVGGGGVHNAALMRSLKERLAPAKMTTHADFGLPNDAKEAVAFAILGYETLCGRPSNMASATGASGPAILGKIALPPPSG